MQTHSHSHKQQDNIQTTHRQHSAQNRQHQKIHINTQEKTHSHINTLVTEKQKFKAGYLNKVAHKWRKISPFYSKQLAAGIRLRLNKKVPLIKCRQHQHSTQERVVIDRLIADMVSRGVVSQTTKKVLILPIFTVPKANTTERRFVLNARFLNRFIQQQHFKMTGVKQAKELLKRNSYMVKVDLAKAFWQIPIHTDHQKLLGFRHNGKTYHFNVLPFGVASAPRIS